VKYPHRPLSPVQQIQLRVFNRHRQADVKLVKRAIAAGDLTAQIVSRDSIRERDNSTCHICGTWVSVHDESLDHVVPLARGGKHDYGNVKLAHKLCNSKKGDRLMGEIDWTTF